VRLIPHERSLDPCWKNNYAMTADLEVQKEIMFFFI